MAIGKVLGNSQGIGHINYAIAVAVAMFVVYTIHLVSRPVLCKLSSPIDRTILAPWACHPIIQTYGHNIVVVGFQIVIGIARPYAREQTWVGQCVPYPYILTILACYPICIGYCETNCIITRILIGMRWVFLLRCISIAKTPQV